MKKLLPFIFTLFYFQCALSQETDKDAKNAVKQLDFIVGEWSGNGWMIKRDGQKHTFTQTENVTYKIDSTAILIEGLGMTNEIVIHNALAIVTFNKQENNYKFNSYLSTGKGGNFKGELKDGKFYWYPNETVRYIIYLNEKGQWFETGEMKRENDWFQFFEMTLDKKGNH